MGKYKIGSTMMYVHSYLKRYFEDKSAYVPPEARTVDLIPERSYPLIMLLLKKYQKSWWNGKRDPILTIAINY